MTSFKFTLLTACIFIAVVPCFGQAVETPTKKPEAVTPEVKTSSEQPDKKPQKRMIMGWREWIWIIKPELILRAKLDTGARTCSIHATNIETVEVDGKKWVKFTVSDPANETSARLRYKAPVSRIAKIKNDSGGLDERYVVSLTFQIGEHEKTGEFTLNDRSKMVCAVLIGRNMLMELGAVDSSRENILKKPEVPAKKKKPVKNVPVN